MAIYGNPLLLGSGGGGEKPQPYEHRTRIHLRAAAGDTLRFWFGQTDNGVVVNWGDGSAPLTYANNLSTNAAGTALAGLVTEDHVYEAAGEYVASLEPINGASLRLGGSYHSPPYYYAQVGSCAYHSGKGIYKVVIGAGGPQLDTYAFGGLSSVEIYDFTACKAVPALPEAEVFYNIAEGCEIRVPAALYDEWVAAAYWSDLAAHIRAA